MKRLQEPTNSNANQDKDEDISSVSKSGKRKRISGQEKGATENENDPNSNISDFDDMYEQIKFRRAKAEAESNLSVNVESGSYKLRRNNPPEPVPAFDDEDEDDINTNKNTNTNQSPTRLQQPPAFINANLMKIKMESDYIPIVAIKQEPLDADEMNDADESGDEFRHPQHLTNSIPIPTSGQITQRQDVEMAQQQQQQQQNEQEKVVVKVEENSNDSIGAVENEVEMEKKLEEEELNNVAKLVDEINKYAERVKSLCKNKRKHQKEIYQLNLVLVKQETKIKNLNSAIILQRDKTKKLKSKVHAQQNLIETLNKKLKSSAEGEPPVENSNSNSIGEPNPNAVKLFNLPTKVLSRIFDYLDLKSLKESRFMCRQWKKEAGKILLKNFYIVCDEKQRCRKTLQKWLKKNNPHSTSNLASKAIMAHKLLSKGEDAKKTLNILKKVPRLRNSITELKYVQWDTQSLHEILNQLPNLQVLETETLDLSPGQKWLNNDKFLNNNGIPVKLELLVQKLETLKKLKLDFAMTKAISAHFFRHAQQLSSVKSLEIHVTGMEFMRSFIKHSLYNWTITRFTLTLQENYNMELIRRFLLSVSPSLQHLKFEGTTSQWNSLSDFWPWTDDWLIPLGLNQLQTLEIEHAFGRDFVLKCIVVALQLRRLKKLSVRFIPEELEEIIHKRNSHESTNGRKLASESLEELEISSWFASTFNSKKIPSNPWPRLKSLKCSCEYSEFFDVSLLSEFGNLERLELNFCWSGTLDKRTMTKDEADDNQSSQPAKFQLRDLKNLKGFYVKFWRDEERYQDFACSLVENDLKFMKSLQCVQFQDIVIDEEPLKAALGPNVSINFG